MNTYKKITVLIPCRDEEMGIGKVIGDIPHEELKHLGYGIEVIVIDNNSVDKTAQIAQHMGAKVIKEASNGKGAAIKTGFDNISDETDYVVMLDGDNTYKASEITRMIEPLESGFADVVIGSRLGGKLMTDSLVLQNRIVNWAYTFLVRHFYYANTTDVLSGYYAWKKPVVDDLKLYIESNSFSIEMEMTTKLVRLGYFICSVPITYDRREGDSKIEAFKDGFDIFVMFFKNLFWTRPLKKERSPQANLKFTQGLAD